MSARRTVIVCDNYERTIRLSLGEPHYGTTRGKLRQSDEIGTGVFARALWIGRKHVVLMTYSQWVRRDGTCTGDTYRMLDVDDARMIERLFGAEAAERVLNALKAPMAETIDAQVQS